uniref:Nucleolar protein 11 C-terminal domain-containing protein n=1 Tax=Picocystis salinarum TaxID=88271 RepID=A0A7S3UCW1_9CHLO
MAARGARCTRRTRLASPLGACYDRLLDEGDEEGRVVLAGAEGTAVCGSETRKNVPLRSRRHRSLACACVTTASKRYAALRGDAEDVVMAWDDRNDHLEPEGTRSGKDRTSVTIGQGRVKQLHLVGKDEQDVLVMLEDGRAMAWDGRGPLLQAKSNAKARKTTCASSQLEDGSVLVATVPTATDIASPADVSLQLYQMLGGNKSNGGKKELTAVQTLTLQGRKNAQVAACAKEGNVLCVLWDDGTLRSYQWNHSKEEPSLQMNIEIKVDLAMADNRTENKVNANDKTLGQKRRRRAIDAEEGKDNMPPRPCMAMINETYVALAYTNKAGHSTVDFYDLKFGCKHATCPLSTEGEEGPGTAETVVKHMVLDTKQRDSLVVTGGQAFYFVEFYLPEPTLASVVGSLSLLEARQKANDFIAKTDDDQLVTDNAQLDVFFRPVWTEETSKDKEQDKNALNTSGTSTDQGSSDTFVKVVEQLWDMDTSKEVGLKLLEVEKKLVDTSLEMSEQGMLEMLVPFMHGKQGGVQLSRVLSLAVERCVDAGYWGCVKQIIHAKRLRDTKHCPKLVPSVLTAEKVKLLTTFLDQSPELAVAEIASILRIFFDASARSDSLNRAMSAAGKTLKNKLNNKKGKQANLKDYEDCKSILFGTGFQEREVCLNSFFSHSIDRTVALAAVSRLSADGVAGLLVYLAKWHILYSTHLNKSVATTAHVMGLHIPNQQQCMDWVTVLLDCHLVQLKLSPHTHGVLRALQIATDHSLRQCRPFLTLDGMARQASVFASQTPTSREGKDLMEVEYLTLA